MKTLSTTDLNAKQELITRYYHNDFSQVKLAIESICRKSQFTFQFNESFKEFLIDTPNFSTIITVVEITPVESSIDLYVSSKRMFKKPSIHIKEWYVALDKNLNLIKKGV